MFVINVFQYSDLMPQVARGRTSHGFLYSPRCLQTTGGVHSEALLLAQEAFQKQQC
jgi:hypothetical protein